MKRTLSEKYMLIHSRCLLNVRFVINEISVEKKFMLSYVNGLQILILPI